ncbi:hypothetical protein SNE35_08775 [Paucibacter sp. R3-3]|uniref:WYL domain-containing protein n=1 Tax=Roseateles agri TaxID=3098619 RepID=A0ABU5DE96_9BURK|nr:hypothetical protein [Paucibacter sp. R3-3]MDY0744598.1 hypothetical protein [Paucibacter sp. R3-3]
MELGTTLFGVARKAANWAFGIVEKLICQRAYELSTLYHDHRILVEARPHPLGEHLGYRLFTEEYLHGARQAMPLIEVCANRRLRLSKVVISVTASNDKVCYQNQVVLHHVDQRRHRAALPAVPFRRPKIEGNKVYTPYDVLRIELLEIRDEANQDLLPRWKVADELHPIDRLEVALGKERDFVEKWGRVYHLQFVEMEASEQMVQLRALYFHRSAAIREFAGLLQHRLVGKALFWVRNAFWARPLQRELNRHIAEYREYEAQRLAQERVAEKIDVD